MGVGRGQELGWQCRAESAMLCLLRALARGDKGRQGAGDIALTVPGVTCR